MAVHTRRKVFLGTVGLATLVQGRTIGDYSGTGDVSEDARRDQAFRIRLNTAQSQRDRRSTPDAGNGDELLYANKIGSFSKALPHNALGEVDGGAYTALQKALRSGESDDFEAIPMGGTVKLMDPQASFCFDLLGSDSHDHELAAPPTLSSAEAAGEMVELYWQSLTRDVPFADYPTNPLVNDAVLDLNCLTDFRGPRASGAVTAGTLFRGVTAGDTIGPYLSQFLSKDIPSGPFVITQRYRSPARGSDFITGFDEWLSIQRGNPSNRGIPFDSEPRYPRNSRDLAWYVRQDYSFQAFVNACTLLLSWGGSALSPTNPYLTSKTQIGFASFGTPNFLEVVAGCANAGLRAAWCAKWLIHSRLRPEAFGGRIHNLLTGAAEYPIHGDALGSIALKRTHGQYGTFLLPCAYPEGSPAHPSYPAGHAVIAGACATALKAFFNEAYLIPDPVVASSDGMRLLPFNSGTLTVGDELNKLAANIAFGRNAAGVHYRSDATNGLLLGEDVAISILRDIAATYHESSFSGFRLTRFDGSVITITPGA